MTISSRLAPKMLTLCVRLVSMFLVQTVHSNKCRDICVITVCLNKQGIHLESGFSLLVEHFTRAATSTCPIQLKKFLFSKWGKEKNNDKPSCVAIAPHPTLRPPQKGSQVAQVAYRQRKQGFEGNVEVIKNGWAIVRPPSGTSGRTSSRPPASDWRAWSFHPTQ